MAYNGPERRGPLSDEQIELIAERAAEKALEKVYASVGKSVVHKILWLVGAAALAAAAYFKGVGKI
jgi:hypothetical protein